MACIVSSPAAYAQGAVTVAEAETPAPLTPQFRASSLHESLEAPRLETWSDSNSGESMLTADGDFYASGSANGDGQIKVVEQRPESPVTGGGPVEQELILEGLVSYGNYKIFASGYDDKLYTAGIEYDRHSWGQFLGANVDYVAEILPFVLLDKPLYVDRYGNPIPIQDKNKYRQQVPGLGISPIGFRLQWRSNSSIRPYLEAKGGVIAFTHKVPDNEASYENFSLQSAGGIQLKLTERWGVRLGLFSDFHFSNAFIVGTNPGLDVMNGNLGISYHF